MCMFIYIYICMYICICIMSSDKTLAFFVFFLPQYIHRFTPMYLALFYESQNFTLDIYIYLVQGQN